MLTENTEEEIHEKIWSDIITKIKRSETKNKTNTNNTIETKSIAEDNKEMNDQVFEIYLKSALKKSLPVIDFDDEKLKKSKQFQVYQIEV